MGFNRITRETNMTDSLQNECLAFKDKFWYPEVMSEENHWVPSADDPLSCQGKMTLYDVKWLANISVFEEALEMQTLNLIFYKA